MLISTPARLITDVTIRTDINLIKTAPYRYGAVLFQATVISRQKDEGNQAAYAARGSTRRMISWRVGKVLRSYIACKFSHDTASPPK